MLQSDTVAVATLYQQAISIFRMGVLCRLPLSAWQVRLYRQPRRWTTSYPTRLELRRWGQRYERCRQLAGGGGKAKKKRRNVLTVAFIRRFLGLSVAIIIVFCIPVDEDGDFSGILNQGHWDVHTTYAAAGCCV